MDHVPSSVVSSLPAVSSNSEGAGSLDSRTEVTDVDGVDCLGSAKTRETLICAGSCFEVARHVCLELLFRGGGSNQLHFGTSHAWSTLNSTKSREVSSSMGRRPQIKEVKRVFVGCLPYLWVEGRIRFTLSTVHASRAYSLVVYHPKTLVFHCTWRTMGLRAIDSAARNSHKGLDACTTFRRGGILFR